MSSWSKVKTSLCNSVKLGAFPGVVALVGDKTSPWLFLGKCGNFTNDGRLPQALHELKPVRSHPARNVAQGSTCDACVQYFIVQLSV